MNYNLKKINKPLIACLETVWYWTTDLKVDDRPRLLCKEQQPREHPLLCRTESVTQRYFLAVHWTLVDQLLDLFVVGTV